MKTVLYNTDRNSSFIKLFVYVSYLFRMYMVAYDYVIKAIKVPIRFVSGNEVVLRNGTCKECRLITVNKTNDLVLINDDTYDVELLETFLKNRTTIVHCSIQDGDNIVCDVTDIVRRFCCYYNTITSMQLCIEYLQHYYTGIYFDESFDFVVYYNDSDFTESRYLLSDVSRRMFVEVFGKR